MKALYYAHRNKDYKLINLLQRYGADTANSLYDTINRTSFDRRLEKGLQKNVYNIKKIATEYNQYKNNRSGSFHDMVHDYQKRGLFSDDFSVIQVNFHL